MQVVSGRLMKNPALSHDRKKRSALELLGTTQLPA
jgi:hypothetical protein